MEDEGILNTIVKILEDHKPHSVADIALKVHLSEEKIKLILSFLAEYSIIAYDEENEKAIICDDFPSRR